MAYKINTAVTGFGIGQFINITTGATVTTGTPVCKRTIDGTGGTCTNAALYNATGLTWEIDLSTSDMNGTNIILAFSLAGSLPINYTLKTETKLVSELNDAITAPTAIENRQEMDTNSTQLAAIIEDTGTTLENRQIEILADVTGLNGDVMRGTDGANTVTPDAAGVAPTAIENRQEMDSNSTQLTAIVGDTNELQGNQGDWATATGFATPTNITAGTITTVSGNVDGSVGSVTGAVGSVIAAVETDATSRTASQADVSDIPNNSEFNARTIPSADYLVEGDTLARVTLVDTTTLNSDMVAEAPTVDEIWAKAMSDLAGIPSVNASAIDALNIMFMALRNEQTASSSAQTISNDAGTPIATAPLGDSGTVTTKGEYV